MKDQPFAIVGISGDRSRSEWQSFIVGNSLKWHHYLDDRGKLMDAFKIEIIPSYVLLDQDGIVRHTWVGSSNEGDIESKAKKLIKAVSEKNPR